MGRHDEAIRQIQKATELDPVSPLVQGDLGWIYLAAKRYEDSVRQSLKTLEIEPHLGARHCLMMAYLRMGRQEQAIEQARMFMKTSGAKPEDIQRLAQGTSAQRMKAFWEWQLRWLRDRAGREYVDPLRLALAYADLGDKEQALRHLE